MKELNYDRLRAALDRLPTYQPPASIWPEIQSDLTKEQNPTATTVGSGIALPEYSPPSAVWNAINKQLDDRKIRRLPLRLIGSWVTKAAAVLLLFGAGYFSATRDSGPTLVITEKVEHAPIRPTFASFSNDDPSFESLLIELEDMNRPSLNGMRLELEELTLAKEEIEAMLVSYGNDAAILNQLADIERERSKVYRRIRAGM